MNILLKLPEDLQIKIGQKVHQDKFKNVLEELQVEINNPVRVKSEYIKYHSLFYEFYHTEFEHNIKYYQLVGDGWDTIILKGYFKFINSNKTLSPLQKDIYLTVGTKNFLNARYLFNNAYTNNHKMNICYNIDNPMPNSTITYREYYDNLEQEFLSKYEDDEYDEDDDEYDEDDEDVEDVDIVIAI